MLLTRTVLNEPPVYMPINLHREIVHPGSSKVRWQNLKNNVKKIRVAQLKILFSVLRAMADFGVKSKKKK